MGKPRVLVVGINPWKDNSGINTLINFFRDWGKESLAHLYTRDGLPNTTICNTFFRISETALIRRILGKRGKTGECVKNSSKEDQVSGLYHRKHSAFMSFAREIVWLIGKWKTVDLKTFLDDFQPDVLFFPIYSTVYMNRLQNYIADYTGKPVILYSSDDNYSYKSISHTPLELLLRFWVRHHERKLFKRADKLLVISPKQKEEYERVFETNCDIMTKGISFNNVVFSEKPLNNPIKMVYTGKMIIGRWKSLSQIALAMKSINIGEEKVQLDIYTTDELSKAQREQLNHSGCHVKGSLTLEEVERVQEEADILVFVESLDKKYKYRARLSFSTKLTDYMRAGKCIFAIGDRDIAPIDYLIRNEAAVVASSNREIKQKLSLLCEQPDLISEYGRRAFECGKKNHNEEKQKQILYKAVKEVI